MNVWHRWRMQFERFNSLNQTVVAWFAILHNFGIQPLFPKLGKHLWWKRCKCKDICPSTTWEGAQTPHICMTWTWDAVWKVLQPQPKQSGMVCTLASGWISANSHNSGEASVVVTVWMWGHTHPHPEKVFKHLIYVWYGGKIQLKRFYSLVVAWFAHLHKVRFQPNLTNLGKYLWR
jgi:hypothetical protein